MTKLKRYFQHNYEFPIGIFVLCAANISIHFVLITQDTSYEMGWKIMLKIKHKIQSDKTLPCENTS